MNATNSSPSRSLGRDALQRILKDRVAVVAFIVIFSYVTLALLCKAGFIFTNFADFHKELTYQPP
ncbi:MAG: hypothetical protein KDD22_04000, partial [Bdellovibrionales bacterium]|nr:hypothetical protein [Bdellovibrionales bacterium]